MSELRRTSTPEFEAKLKEVGQAYAVALRNDRNSKETHALKKEYDEIRSIEKFRASQAEQMETGLDNAQGGYEIREHECSDGCWEMEV